MSNPKDKKLLKSCLMGCLILIGIGVVLVVGGVFGLRYWLHQSAIADLSPEERDELKFFLEQPITLPEDWLNPEPFSEEVSKAALNFNNTWERIAPADDQSQWYNLLKTFRDEGRLSDRQWQTVETAIARRKPVLEALDQLLAVPDYELEAFPHHSPNAELPNYLKVMTAAKLYSFQAYIYARQEEWDKAIDSGMQIFKLNRRHQASFLMTHLIAIGGNEIASGTLFRITQTCNNPRLLQRTLYALNQQDSKINQNALAHSLQVDSIAFLRDKKRRGYPVELTSGKTGIEYARLYQPAISPEHSRLAALPGFIRHPIEEKIIAEQVATTVETRTRENISKARYDLLRLSIVQRLKELKVDVPASTTKDWLDPFSGKPYCFHKQQQTYYSIGPDKTDNTLSISYDPTNGTISDGDIRL